MIELNGTKYITDKEASVRYGYSKSWFQNQRYKKLPPPFVKLQGKGKVYYSVHMNWIYSLRKILLNLYS